MRAPWVTTAFAIAACTGAGAPAPPSAPPVLCYEGAAPCPRLEGHAITCEGGACVARPAGGGAARADCGRLGAYAVLLDQDERNCGACGRWCVAGARCVAGACLGDSTDEPCEAGLARCGGACVDLVTDPSNCGVCGARCEEERTCAAGQCQRKCPPGQLACDDRCVDPASDPRHCGACGRSCGAGRCVNGVCGCPAGTAPCDAGRCVSVLDDRARCGACDRRCADDEYCEAGACRSCGAGSALCDGRCMDVRSSSADCGACGRRCPAWHGCVDGACVPQCPASRAVCGDACVDLASDQRHCGRCANDCTDAAYCRGGACVSCPAGQVACGDICHDPRVDDRHCGGCRMACGAGQGCVDGRCVTCAPWMLRCPGEIGGCGLDWRVSRLRCGGCDLTCADTFFEAAACVEGRCVGRGRAGLATCGSLAALDRDDVHCGACDVACRAGERCVEGRCVTFPIRPLAPISGRHVTGARPWLRWEPPAGADGARVEVCPGRDCATVAQRWEADGDRTRPPAPLRPGIYFWRLFARRAGRFDDAPGPVWEFAVSDAPASGGAPPPVTFDDFNGDGELDEVTSSRVERPDHFTSSRLQVWFGPAAGRAPDQVIDGDEDGRAPSLYGAQRTTITPASLTGLGDVDGDGYGDFLAVVRFDVYDPPPATSWAGQRAYFFAGSPRGLRPVPGYAFAGSPWGLGDDGDGYGDALVATTLAGSSAPGFAWRRGGRRGVAAGDVIPARCAGGSIALGDFDADGRTDLAVFRCTGLRDPLPDSVASVVTTTGRVELSWCTPPAPPREGAALTGFATDEDGDGFDDLVVQPIDGAAVVYRGGAGGLSSSRCAPRP